MVAKTFLNYFSEVKCIEATQNVTNNPKFQSYSLCSKQKLIFHKQREMFHKIWEAIQNRKGNSCNVFTTTPVVLEIGNNWDTLV